MRTGRLSILSILTALTLATNARADDPSDEEKTERADPAQDASSEQAQHEALARKLQNPFADLISLPFQNITTFGYGPDDGGQNILNIQPVIPIHVTKQWNLLMRPILPVSYASWPAVEFGLGDVNVEPFLSPASPGGVAWGLGAVVGIPTASGDSLGTGKWTAGPSIALFGKQGHWTFSAIVNQQWSYAGDSARTPVSLFQLQPSVNYILKHGWYITCGPFIAANWTAPSGQQWTVPVGGGIGKIFSLSGQKMGLQLEGYANVVRPDNGPDAFMIFTWILLFPA
jgi:hypothetical protein